MRRIRTFRSTDNAPIAGDENYPGGSLVPPGDISVPLPTVDRIQTPRQVAEFYVDFPPAYLPTTIEEVLEDEQVSLTCWPYRQASM